MVTQREPVPARDLLSAARTMVAVTDDEDRHPQARQLAIGSARSSGARVILYDLAAASSLMSPRPTGWSGEGEPELYGDPLEASELERLGRMALVQQISAASAEGVEAAAWLPDRPGMGPLLEYARRHDADVVLVPEEVVDDDVIDRLLGRTPSAAADAERRSAVPVLLVAPDGTWRDAGEAAER